MDPKSAGNAYSEQDNPQDPIPTAEAAPPPPPAGAEYGAPPVPQYSASSQPPVAGAITQDERLWATFMHLAGILIGILGSVTLLPMLSFLGPLILWLIKRNESAFLDDQGKEALNFHITVAIALAVSFVVCLPLWLIVIGIFLWGLCWTVIGIATLVLSIIAAIKANNGEYFRYPFILRLVK